MNELERFKKKAAGYRRALEEYPAARILELYPILWYLEKYRECIGKSRRALRVVDLMSGSGFLSENLYKLGYRELHAVEFCKEMYQNSWVSSNANLHVLSSFDHLEAQLDRLRPDVIISIASFHHLIVYNSANDVDKEMSIGLQRDVVNICMRSLSDKGMLIIADLIEDEVSDSPVEPFKGSWNNSFTGLKKLGVSENVIKCLRGCNSLHGVSSQLNRELRVKPGNVSLQWFRSIVGTNTTVGHNDVALSNAFLNNVLAYRQVVTKYVCPWLFENEPSLKDFIYNKFGFGLDAGQPCGLTKEQVAELANEKLGIRRNYGLSALGWNLGVVLLSKLEPFGKERQYNLTYASLLWMIVVLVIALLLRFVGGFYMPLDAKQVLAALLSLPLGILLGEIIRGWRGMST